MRPPSDPELASFGDPPSLRRRAVSFVGAVAITCLIILGFLGLNGGLKQPPRFKGSPLSLELNPNEDSRADTTKAEQKVTRAAPAAAPPPRPIPVPIEKPPPIPTKQPSPYILLTKEEYEKFDFRKIGSAAAAAGQGQQQAAEAGTGAGDSRPIGTAPDGQPLYAAEWFRRPTHAELSTYLPRSMPSGGGVGLIACKTAPRYHVEDCVELGSAPPGSHLAGAVRQAAWQFLVRPPRVGGRDMIGTWVRIRIDYTITTRVARGGSAGAAGPAASDAGDGPDIPDSPGLPNVPLDPPVRQTRTYPPGFIGPK